MTFYAVTEIEIQSNLLYATTQNAKTEWSLTGGARFQESNHRGSLPRRGLGTSILWKIMLLDAISSYAMCSSMLTKYHSAHSENRDRRMREVVAYKRLKIMENN